MGIDTVVKRHQERGRYDSETLNGILDEALICHVAFSMDNQPYNMPMIPVRIGSDLYLHTSIKSRIYKVLSSGIEACATATLLDGLVLAKSAYNSSMNYRSAIVFGKMSPVTDDRERLAVAKKLTEKIASGRWSDCRHPSEGELKATGFLKLPITKFSAKIRSGPPIDNPEDLKLPFWSGVVPVTTVKGIPETSPVDRGKIDLPGYLIEDS